VAFGLGRLIPLKAGFKLFGMGVLGVLLATSACQRSRAVGLPKAVAVRDDGALELTLMSFNVRYENLDDSGPLAWSQRIPGAVRMLRAHAPDVFGVQEALHGQAADLWASLPEFEFYGRGRDDGGTAGEYSGVFYRRDRFELDVRDAGTFWLSDTPEKPGSMTWGNEIPRVATWLRLLDRATGRGFYVFNTHWDHRSQVSRERAALLMARKIDERRQCDEPVVLLGDFNSIESNPGIVYLTGGRSNLAGATRTWKSGMRDTFQTLHPKQRDRRTLHFWRGSLAGNLKVDHIFVSKNGEVREAAILSQEKPMVSDHFPVMARVIFPLD